MKSILTFLFLTVLAGCNPTLNPNPDFEQELVVEGELIVDRGARVVLTFNAGVFDEIDSANALEYFSRRAKVEVIGETEQEILTLSINKQQPFPPLIYESRDLLGKSDEVYQLRITLNDQVYESETVIPKDPDLRGIDLETTSEDSLKNVWIRFWDNPETNDFYRLLYETNEQPGFRPVFLATLDDQSTGSGDIRFPVLRQNRENTSLTDEATAFRVGSTVTVRLLSMTADGNDFWRTVDREVTGAGTFFSGSGQRVLGNVVGDKPVIGLWAGYGVADTTFVVK